ncbi:hypothetical protein SCACP_39260 [Sporomusa carbonis]
MSVIPYSKKYQDHDIINISVILVLLYFRAVEDIRAEGMAINGCSNCPG